MDAKRFIRAIYKASTPSIDYDKVERIIPWEHAIPMNVYESILIAMGIEDGSDEMMSCNMFMLDKGPKLVDLSEQGV